MRAPIATLLAVSLAFAPALAPADARADQPAPKPAPAPSGVDAEADQLLDEGTRLFTEDADYDAALDAFRRSYEMRPSWKALSGTALVYQQQGRLVEAIETYERLLAEFGATLTEAQLGTVKKRVAELERRVGVLVVEIVQPGAHVTVDGQEVGIGPAKATHRLLPGPHTVVATLDGHVTRTERIEVRAGEKLPLRLELEPEKVKVVVEKQPVKLERRYAGWLPWAVAGGGVAVGAIGGLLHLKAADEFQSFNDLVNATPPPSPGSPREVDEAHKRRGERYQVAAISLYAVGGAVVVTGLVLVYANRLRPVEKPRAAVRPLVGHRSLGVAIDF